MTGRFSFPPKSIVVVLGTRPEIVKLAHIIRMLGEAARVVHTGQHYDPNLSDDFFREMNLPAPDLFLQVGGTSRGHQIGEGLRTLDSYFSESPPRAVVVQGDTNAVMAGALAANARNVFLCHIEGGLRSHDRAMPEEHNRVITDHLSDLSCAPTQVSVDNLLREGIPDHRIALTGNTIVEAVKTLMPPPEERAQILDKYELSCRSVRPDRRFIAPRTSTTRRGSQPSSRNWPVFRSPCCFPFTPARSQPRRRLVSSNCWSGFESRSRLVTASSWRSKQRRR